MMTKRATSKVKMMTKRSREEEEEEQAIEEEEVHIKQELEDIEQVLKEGKDLVRAIKDELREKVAKLEADNTDDQQLLEDFLKLFELQLAEGIASQLAKGKKCFVYSNVIVEVHLLSTDAFEC